MPALALPGTRPSPLPLLLLLPLPLPLLPLLCPLFGCVFFAFGDLLFAWPGGVVRACWGLPFGDGLGFGCRGGVARGTTVGDGDRDGRRSPPFHECFGAGWRDDAGAGDCPGRCPVLAATATPPPNAASVAATTATLTVA